MVLNSYTTILDNTLAPTQKNWFVKGEVTCQGPGITRGGWSGSHLTKKLEGYKKETADLFGVFGPLQQLKQRKTAAAT